MKLPARILACQKCGTRFDADSNVLYFTALGALLGFLLALVLCSSLHPLRRQKPRHKRGLFQEFRRVPRTPPLRVGILNFPQGVGFAK
jgi:hypothetical protein